MSRCKKVDFSMEDCMSMVEILKSEDMQIRVNKRCPTVSVELCNGVKIFATKESKNGINVLTTASQSVSMDIPKKEGTYDPNDEEDEGEKCLVIPETYSSKVTDEDTFKTEAQLGID